jgi:hypothetical protein
MNDLMLAAWKAQLDNALRALETVTEAAIRVHEAQLQAAAQAQAKAGKSFAYWRSLAQAATPSAGPGLKLDAIDRAYQQWLETVQRFYKPFEKAGS